MPTHHFFMVGCGKLGYTKFNLHLLYMIKYSKPPILEGNLAVRFFVTVCFPMQLCVTLPVKMVPAFLMIPAAVQLDLSETYAMNQVV